MENPIYLPSISIALYDRALKAANSGQTCNVIMLCTASMEAFINEYMELGVVLIENDKKQRQEIDKNKEINKLRGKSISYFNAVRQQEIELIEDLFQLEKDRKNIFDKINTIKKHCEGNIWNKGNGVYGGYCTLVNIRNALMHPRSKAVEYGENHTPTFLLPFYQQKKINYFNEINKNMSWVEAIDTVEFASWCINAFEKMMISILKVMYEAKIEDSPQLPLMTSQHALYYLRSFKFPDKLIKKLLTPL